MGSLINLKKARKRIEREKAATTATSNRIRFGRTKAQKSLDRQRVDRADEILDQHRLEDGERS